MAANFTCVNAGGRCRAEAYKSVLEAAKGRLLAAIPRMSPEKLTQLLELSFAYVGLPQLRDVPLAVLGRLQPVPAAFLKQLATDQELFQDLPLNVQQEVRHWLDAHVLLTAGKFLAVHYRGCAMRGYAYHGCGTWRRSVLQ